MDQYKKRLRNRPIEERFWNKVKKADGCWEWQGTIVQGYGKFHAHGKLIGAHRLSWNLHYGDIAEGFFVCHKCDNPRCVNPDHLFLGTCLDNVRDMIAKGRDHHSKNIKPHKMYRVDLNSIIKKNGHFKNRIADKIGVSTNTFGGWCTGKVVPSWEQIEKIANVMNWKIEDFVIMTSGDVSA